ncbi:NAD(P)H-binding protein [Cognatilysobacter bugurensis]|uniref:Nucleoside-diphosphate sugar epimerase n=1 Tax=Cognatilysobacter bugurensis TaxID=543356 RepID=A0A918SZJ6_9GAMM|nr:NAD(P)H-binding protein [Lysobacter bugurensis]GHA79288.1 nucleoside-diphosphate sugar epimerase [Lysobacter bugurensis]
MPSIPNDPKARRALVLGATGLVGSALVQRLLTDERYDALHVIARRPLAAAHAKLQVTVTGFDGLADHARAFAVDHVFCCLGTTIRQAGSREAFRRVDLDYVVEAARLAAQARAGHFLWVSSIGADPNSRAFYPRIKGQAEQAIASLPLARWTALRPSLLLGDRMDRRPGERMAAAVLTRLRPLMRGPLQRYRPVHADAVAAAMVAYAQGNGPTQAEVASRGIEVVGGGAAGDTA